VLITDNEKFEQYLKNFQPMPPLPLPAMEEVNKARFWPLLAAWAAGAAMIGIGTILMLHPRPAIVQLKQEVISERPDMPHPHTQPLTIGIANALLASAPSTKAAVDDMAAQEFQSQRFSQPEGMQGALAVLSKEKTKL
jgi:hypothetical protein